MPGQVAQCGPAAPLQHTRAAPALASQGGSPRRAVAGLKCCSGGGAWGRRCARMFSVASGDRARAEGGERPEDTVRRLMRLKKAVARARGMLNGEVISLDPSSL